ncbi:MAG: hypothetical protein JWQ09_2708 [Segetibacter sp.]|nr:hypothetical protein [Segetibacter sp.]
MQINIRTIARNVFAFTLFLFGFIYITNADFYARYFAPIPAAMLLVYITAFVDVSVALSILLKMQIRKACLFGGIYWLAISLTTFIIQMYKVVANSNLQQVNEGIITLISALGYTAAIFYIGFSEE